MSKLLFKNRPLVCVESTDEEGAGEERVYTDPRHESFKDKTFTQAEITEYMTREKAQGKRAGAREYAEKLAEKYKAAGLDETTSIDDLIALAKAKREADDALKSEAEKAKDEADRLAAAAAADRVAAAKDRFDAKVERLLAGAVKVEVAKASLAAYNVNVDSTDEEITAAVESLKADAPGLFTTVASIPNSDSGKSGAAGAGQKTAREIAREYAVKRGWVEKTA